MRIGKDGSNEGIRDAAEAKAAGEPIGQTSVSTPYSKWAPIELLQIVGNGKDTHWSERTA